MSICRLGPAGLLILALAGGSALAQAPAEALPAPPACVAPTIVERMSVPSEDIAHLQQLANAYGECMKSYIDARQAAANAYAAKANAETEAGNAAARQANAFFEAVKAYAAKHAKD
jgi:hypothetical protein